MHQAYSGYRLWGFCWNLTLCPLPSRLSHTFFLQHRHTLQYNQFTSLTNAFPLAIVNYFSSLAGIHLLNRAWAAMNNADISSCRGRCAWMNKTWIQEPRHCKMLWSFEEKTKGTVEQRETHSWTFFILHSTAQEKITARKWKWNAM